MSIRFFTALSGPGLRAVVAASAVVACLATAPSVFAPPACAQQPPAGVTFKVRGANERMEMTVNASRVVEFGFEVPRMMVNNPEIIRVSPISSRSIQISAMRPGVTQLNVWDADNNVTSIDIIVTGDVAELEMTLRSLFPEAALRLRPLNSSLYISGFVPKAEMVTSILRVAQDYFPSVIDDMRVGGVHKILLHVKVLEISRTKLRNLGFDWVQLSAGISQSVSGVLPSLAQGQVISPLMAPGSATIRAGIASGSNFAGFLEALRENDLARLMAEPTLATLDGRPATFNVGGQVPIPLQQALGVTTVQYRQFGTQIDFVPIILGNGMIRLEVRPDVTEIDPSLRDSVTGVPGFRQRMADTAVELKAGQTMVIAGLVFTREDSINRGLPILADLPWIGIPFRRVSNLRNDVEMLIFVTPEFCEAMDPNEVPPCGPGQLTTTPTDCELFGRGYLEVPKNCPGGNCGPGLLGPSGPGGPGMDPMYDQLPATPGQPIAPPAGGGNSAQKPTKATGPVASTGRPIGTGAKATTVSTSRTVQPSTASKSSNTTRNPSPSASAPGSISLIGPQGYDDLK
jgi:pilus assembly protein CpaC